MCTKDNVAAAGTALGIDEFHCKAKRVRNIEDLLNRIMNEK